MAKLEFLKKILDRRHHLHLRQPGKNDTTGTDDGNGKNENSFPEPSATLQDSNRRCVFFACRHPRMSCTRRGVKTEHLVARTFFTVLLVSGAGLMSVAS